MWLVPIIDVVEFRFELAALLHNVRTAGAEGTAGRRTQRGGDITTQNDAAGFGFWVGYGNGRQQCSGVGVARLAV